MNRFFVVFLILIPVQLPAGGYFNHEILDLTTVDSIADETGHAAGSHISNYFPLSTKSPAIDDGTLKHIPDPPLKGLARDINRFGTVVGTIDNKAFRYPQFDGGIFVPFSLPNLSESHAHGLNNFGHTVGYFVLNDGKYQGFWVDSQLNHLFDDQREIKIYDIDDNIPRPALVGEFLNKNGFWQAFRFQHLDAGTNSTSTAFVPLTLESYMVGNSVIHKINNNGAMAGSVDISGAKNAAIFEYINGELVLQTNLLEKATAAVSSEALSLNDDGVVVGFERDSTGVSKGFLYYEEDMLDISTVTTPRTTGDAVPYNPSGHVVSVEDINNLNEMVAKTIGNRVRIVPEVHEMIFHQYLKTENAALLLQLAYNEVTAEVGALHRGVVEFYIMENGRWGAMRAQTLKLPTNYVSNIAFRGDWLAVGVPTQDVDVGGNIVATAGMVLIYKRVNNAWNGPVQLIESIPLKNNRFGNHMAFHERSFVVANGFGNVYSYNMLADGPDPNTEVIMVPGSQIVRIAMDGDVLYVYENSSQQIKTYVWGGQKWVKDKDHGGNIPASTNYYYAVKNNTMLVGYGVANILYIHRNSHGRWFERRPALALGKNVGFGRSMVFAGDKILVSDGYNGIYSYELNFYRNAFKKSALSLQVTAPSQVEVHHPFVYMIKVENQSQSHPGLGVAINMQIPVDADYQWPPTCRRSQQAQNGRCLIKEIAANSMIELPVTVTPRSTATMIFTADMKSVSRNSQSTNVSSIDYVAVMDSTPELQIDYPKPEGFIAYTTPDQEIFVNFAVLGTSRQGSIVRYRFSAVENVPADGVSCQPVATDPVEIRDTTKDFFQIPLKQLGTDLPDTDIYCKLHMELVKLDGEVWMVDGKPVSKTVQFSFGQPGIDILSPLESTEYELTPKADTVFRTAFLVKGWDMNNGGLKITLNYGGQNILICGNCGVEAVSLDIKEPGDYALTYVLYSNDETAAAVIEKEVLFRVK